MKKFEVTTADIDKAFARFHYLVDHDLPLEETWQSANVEGMKTYMKLYKEMRAAEMLMRNIIRLNLTEKSDKE